MITLRNCNFMIDFCELMIQSCALWDFHASHLNSTGHSIYFVMRFNKFHLSSDLTLFLLERRVGDWMLFWSIFLISQATQIKHNISRFSGFVWHDNEVNHSARAFSLVLLCLKVTPYLRTRLPCFCVFFSLCVIDWWFTWACGTTLFNCLVIVNYFYYFLKIWKSWLLLLSLISPLHFRTLDH